MVKRVLVPLAEGFEEMEAVVIIDVLRRAGVEVHVAGLEGAGPVSGSRGITVHAEVDLDEVAHVEHDAVVLPGGLGGTHAMRDDPRVVEAVQRSHGGGRLTAAICAAPLVLQRAGLAAGKRLTSHPSVTEELKAGGAEAVPARVVRDGHLLTSQGPGTAFEFALAVVEDLVGAKEALELAGAMCVGGPSS